GHEEFPHAGGAEGAHGMEASVPVVEVADHGDAGGAGGPDGEGDAAHAVDLAQVRAEFFVDAVFVAFVEEVEVLFAEGGQEAVGVVELVDLAVGAGGRSEEHTSEL